MVLHVLAIFIAVIIYTIFVFAAGATIAFNLSQRRKPKIDQNVEWLPRPLRRGPCDTVYAGNMLEHIKAHATHRTVETLARNPISLN